MIRHYEHDLMILSVTLGDMDAFDVLRRMHGAGPQMPVLLLSDLSSPDARVRALNAGADDIVSRHFQPEELCARIRAIVRRSKGHSQSWLQVGPLQLNLETHEVSLHGKPLHLSVNPRSS